ncbi:hypothetical protein CLG96_13940 [Sphingomonas oleivorans]|uniref:DUF2382 domain-containing protein n=2 Tax=Sphingomonas oleivorans TaxID=1735121 RepID=A0A2T5FX41_9SPHN|nr:hypothetical protein CLG96_13940 [Sphingomonas oleivorans]
MSRTITALFDNRQDAEAAADRLRQSRIDADRIHVIDQTSPGYGERANGERGLWASVKDFFLPDEDRQAYEEGIRRGCVLVTARVEELESDEAIRILEESRSVDFDQRQEEWRSSGWTGIPSSGEAVDTSASAGRRTTGEAVSEEHIPIVEEQLRVGKREVSRGGVRVRSYIVETPVHEDVTLREEHVSVERRPVGERVSTADLNEADLMRERVVEVSESAEEAVVSKEATVREEVVIRKTAEEHVKTIDETVRHTEVDIEKEDERTKAERDRVGTDRDRTR